MSDAPETIWTAPTSGSCHVGFDTMSMNYTVEYRRADLSLTTDQLVADPRVKALVEAIQDAIDANPTELNLGNYDHDDVCKLQNEAIDVWQILTTALAQLKEPKE